MQILSLNPNDPLHPTYNARKRYVQAEYLGPIKTALIKTTQNVNFADQIQTGRAHDDLMNDLSREARYIGTQYSMQIDPYILSGISLFHH